jgi:hypothetical protein
MYRSSSGKPERLKIRESVHSEPLAEAEKFFTPAATASTVSSVGRRGAASRR